jgi:tetratricopeptide (TPR) repeat protein
MRRVREELEQCLALDETIAPAGAATFTPRPPVEAAPIRAQWRRETSSGPTPQQLRREGFRRGLLAGAVLLLVAAFGFTFFVLPGLVASRQPAATTGAAGGTPQPAPAAAAQQNETSEPDFERLAELKRRAEERRGPLPQRLEQLTKRDAATWAAAALAAARADLAAGDAAMERREYEAALKSFEALVVALDALEKRVPTVVAERLAQARAAFDAGRSAEARAAFESVLRVDPQNAVAKTGVARATVLDAVLRETAQGTQAEHAAREGVARLQARATGDAYSSAIAQAQLAFARRDYTAAQAAYERAAKLRPGAPEAAEGLAQIRRATETSALAGTVDRALAAEREERWSDALKLHREALQQAPALRAAQEGVERSEPRAMLDAELQAYLDKPERLYSVGGRDVARHVLERASRVTAPGPRLQSQRARLQTALEQAETPIRVALASDNVTEVQIYRVGKLGLFERKDLELMPGRYTVVGTRAGYRDVRKEINLLPGASPPTVDVRCEERI